ncbi:hypothetical protein [Halomonas sp. PR-M31]|nr:hypothetical protein [Halomonas sp. PR-M31]
MRIFKNAWFDRFAKKQKLKDAAQHILELSEEHLAEMIQKGQFSEVKDDD